MRSLRHSTVLMDRPESAWRAYQRAGNCFENKERLKPTPRATKYLSEQAKWLAPCPCSKNGLWALRLTTFDLRYLKEPASQKLNRAPTETVLPGFFPNNDAPRVRAPVQQFCLLPKDPVGLLSRSRSSFQRRNRHGTRAYPKAFHKGSRQRRRCLNDGQLLVLALAPATCNQPFPLRYRDRYRFDAWERLFVSGRFRFARAWRDQSPES